MQIEIDFQVFKALTALRESEADSYNAVLHRLLNLPHQNALLSAAEGKMIDSVSLAAMGQSPRNALAAFAEGRSSDGAWFDNIFFPNGTRFRANYKGQTFIAEINSGRWVGADGVFRTSPSGAASAISHTNVNGWRFWYAQLPNDPSWRRLDEFKA